MVNKTCGGVKWVYYKWVQLFVDGEQIDVQVMCSPDTTEEELKRRAMIVLQKVLRSKQGRAILGDSGVTG